MYYLSWRLKTFSWKDINHGDINTDKYEISDLWGSRDPPLHKNTLKMSKRSNILMGTFKKVNKRFSNSIHIRKYTYWSSFFTNKCHQLQLVFPSNYAQQRICVADFSSQVFLRRCVYIHLFLCVHAYVCNSYCRFIKVSHHTSDMYSRFTIEA